MARKKEAGENRSVQKASPLFFECFSRPPDQGLATPNRQQKSEPLHSHCEPLRRHRSPITLPSPPCHSVEFQRLHSPPVLKLASDHRPRHNTHPSDAPSEQQSGHPLDHPPPELQPPTEVKRSKPTAHDRPPARSSTTRATTARASAAARASTAQATEVRRRKARSKANRSEEA